MQLDASWIGRTVSSVTLMEEDLIPLFEQVLSAAGVPFSRPPSVNQLLDPNKPCPKGIALERVGWYLDELFDKMDGIAPEGCYFGAHSGDGALFGFWLVEEKTFNKKGDYFDE